ncbi:MAG: hypothetical protein GY940_20490 [bacterium]|nr:hypothetical protein [bacterium]
MGDSIRKRERDFDLISIFHTCKTQSGSLNCVDDGTWFDLGMDDIFSKIDRTVSAVGRQFLYHMMRTYSGPSASERTHRLYRLLKEDVQLRERIQLLLYKLKDDNASYIPYLLFEPLPQKPGFFNLFYLLSAASVLSLILMFFVKIFLLVFLAVSIVNLIIHNTYSRRIYGQFASLGYLNIMLNVAHRLGNIKTSGKIEQLEYLKKKRTFAKNLSKRIGWLVIDKAALGELAFIFIEYLNQFLLFDIIVFFRSMGRLKESRKDIALVYEAVASLDACIAAASVINDLDSSPVPAFNDEGKIHFEKLYHPLLEHPVANSVSLNNRSALITGSNMAGKTTFIKTVGVNLILARTLFFCFAGTADVPLFEVKSFIQREDDLEQGKSYYFVEVEKMLEFIRLPGNRLKGNGFVFLVDEMFRGTNTIERVSITASVLKHLGSDNIVLATTHDVKLKDFLKEDFDMYHFSEQIVDGQYGFDYLIKPGPCRTRNAIKLLELSNYPPSITEMAHKISEDLPLQ